MGFLLGQMSLSKLPSFSVVGDANGWAPEDMFATNEREYGVQTTFKENLEGYTVPLNTDKSSEEYRYTLAITYCCLKDKLSYLILSLCISSGKLLLVVFLWFFKAFGRLPVLQPS